MRPHRSSIVVAALASLVVAGAARAETPKDQSGSAMIELGAGVGTSLMWSAAGPTYALTGPSFGVQVAVSLDRKATHRLFVGARYTGLDSVGRVLKDGAAPAPAAADGLDPLAKVPAMLGLGYSVGVADTGLRAGLAVGYANVERDGGYTHGWTAGVFVQIPVLTFRLGD